MSNPLAAAGAQPGGLAYYYLAASALPTVITDTVELSLGGRYQIDKKSAVRVRYTYSHMHDVDWSYAGMQFGTGTNYMPTNEQAPNYTVQTFGLSYIYTFN